MAAFKRGKIVRVVQRREDLVIARVAVAGDEIESAGFPSMLGKVQEGDAVIVNTTGVELGLGSGGVAFILWNLDGEPPPMGRGHIVKMRYTPWQTEVLAVEAPESPHHGALAEVDSLAGMPVIVCSLHSQIGAVAAAIKQAAPSARVGYLMTDGAALPLAWSRLVRALRDARLLDITCTAGHAFGGDLEAVNVFSGLAALRHAAGADAAVVAMGPGVVGTETVLGFTGMEQGQVLDAATALSGRAIASLRINFADPRPRHYGVSHHSLTSLRVAAREPCTVAVPILPQAQMDAVMDQLRSAGIADRHRLVVEDGRSALDLLDLAAVRPASMGRSVEEVPELFLAAAAAGRVAAAGL